MIQKLQTTQASGGQMLDIVRFNGNDRLRVYNMDILENLEAAPYNADTSVLYDSDQDATRFNNHVVGIPDDLGVAGFAYLRSLTKKYLGTENPEELEAMLSEWDAFIEIGKEVDEKSGGKVKMMPGLTDVYTVLSSQTKEPLFDGDKFNTKAMRGILDRLVQVRDAKITGKLDPYPPGWMASFSSNNFMFNYSAVWSQFYVFRPNDKEKGRWGLMAAPGGPFTLGGSFNGIPKSAKNKELAWKFIEFANLSQEGAKAQKKDGIFSHYKSAYEDPEFSNWTWPNYDTQNIGEKFFVDIAPNVKSVPQNLNDSLVAEAMTFIIQKMQKDNSFGTEEALKVLEKELKTKNSNIVFK